MCSATCSKCCCLDDESFKFDHNGKFKDCSCFEANEDRVDFRRSMYCYEDPEAELPGASDTTIGSKFIRVCGFCRGNSLSVPQIKVCIILRLSFQIEMPFFLPDSYVYSIAKYFTFSFKLSCCFSSTFVRTFVLPALHCLLR